MQTLTLKPFAKQDYNLAIQSAIRGMHFDWYLAQPWLQRLYGRYFLYLEMNRASHIFAAYQGQQFAGLLLCEMYGAPKAHRCWWQSCYVKGVDWLQKCLFKQGVQGYEQANQAMKADYLRQHQPDGEIIFLAANPQLAVKGVGSFLLQALAEQVKGKTLFLYTDDQCNYTFYEKKGFQRVGERTIELNIHNRQLPLTCLMYSKKFA
ncbi:GNAT family N-acetyltransferase [Volucribacter amazonae]|uniref:N-acetyltransferase domain-containing protein n=1 Tax=Volucribacter amazonae TaxID=256731 RepID=A0A9X4PBR2_9PAST|nr:GNAT family N-acetyltransferase [Volucribacter amazonae]MDG6895342.1 hypothetical protein [Volucribacter amazonae]